MAIVVKKFGGTSLSSDDGFAKAVSHVQKSIFGQDQVVVVVSSAAGVTSDLLSRAEKLGRCKAEMDSILASGEQVQASLFALALQRAGINARSFLGWQIPIITDDNHLNAKVTSANTGAVKDFMSVGVPVVAGFQGISRTGRITTLGRGGSDITAAVLAGELDASCEIYTDVDGVYPADPKIVADAVPYESICDEDLVMLAECGSKVVHKEASLLIQRNSIPTKILSSQTGRGTRVVQTSLNTPAWGVVLQHVWRVCCSASFSGKGGVLNAEITSQFTDKREFVLTDDEIACIDRREVIRKTRYALLSIIGWKGDAPTAIKRSFALNGISIYHTSIVLKRCNILVDADRGSEAASLIYHICFNGGDVAEEDWLLASSSSSN